MKYAIVIEVEGEDDLIPAELEKEFAAVLKKGIEEHGATVTNVEVARGSLAEAFGVGVV